MKEGGETKVKRGRTSASEIGRLLDLQPSTMKFRLEHGWHPKGWKIQKIGRNYFIDYLYMEENGEKILIEREKGFIKRLPPKRKRNVTPAEAKPNGMGTNP